MVHGSFIARTRPGAKIAVLYQDEALGTELLAGLKRGLARSKARVLAAEPVAATPVDLQAQLATLKASGADVLALFVAPADATRAFGHANRLGWRPLIVTDAASRVEGSISIAFLKDPGDPRWRSDPAIKLYRSIMARHARGANVKDVHHVHGMAVAYQTVEVLKAAGKNLTRAGLMAQTRKLNDASNPFLLPGSRSRRPRRSASRSSRRCCSAGRRGAGRASAGSGATAPARRPSDRAAWRGARAKACVVSTQAFIRVSLRKL